MHGVLHGAERDHLQQIAHLVGRVDARLDRLSGAATPAGEEDGTHAVAKVPAGTWPRVPRRPQ